MTPGQDVLVDFAGQTHPGVVIAQHGQWVMCRIHTDPIWDYGAITDRLDPEQTVCVRECCVREMT